jgi:transketolase
MAKLESTVTWTVYDADKMTQREIYGIVLTDLGKQYPEIVGLSADLAKSTKIGTFGDAYPDRFFNLGIAEQNLFGVSAGLAKAGLIPFRIHLLGVCIWSRLRICAHGYLLPKLNVKVIATHGGISFGSGGATHHGTEDYSASTRIPEPYRYRACGRHRNSKSRQGVHGY